MSPSWRDRVRIGVTPDYVATVRIPAGLRPAIAQKHCVACHGDAARPVWEPALSALREALEKIGSGSADVMVVLSDRFMRYALVPWNERVTKPAEELAFARHCFTNIYGEAAQAWELRLSPARMGHARIASAIDREFLDSIREVFSRSRLRLRSIQPHLMAAYNRWRRSLNRGACLFLLAEKRLYTSLSLDDGDCRAVRSGPVNGSLTQDLPLILDREHVWSGFQERPAVFLHAPDRPDLKLPAGEAGKALQLDATAGYSPMADFAYTIALTPA